MPKILLVEDSELSRDMLRRRLERRGYTVVTAADGAEGVTAALHEAPDLILMDLGLPVLDGCDATRRLKGDPATAAIPIIALTASDTVADREKALQAGCDDFDTKPVDLASLGARIEALLQQAHP